MTPEPSSGLLYARLLRQVRPYWRVFAVSLVSMIILAATEPALPALLKPLIDGTFVDRDPTLIKLMPVVLVLLFGVRGLASFASQFSLMWVANKVVVALRTQMFDKLMTLPTRYYDEHASGNLISKVTYNVNNVTGAATSVLIVLVRDSLAVLGLLTWMLYLDWQLSLMIFTAAPFIIVAVKVIGKRLRRLSRTVQHLMGDLTHVLEEAILGHKVVKVFGGESYESTRFRRVAEDFRHNWMKVVAASAANVPVVQLIGAIAMAVIVYIASLHAAAGEITIGDFASFFGAAALLFSPIKRLTGINEHLQRGLAAAESVFQLLDEPSESRVRCRTVERLTGQIEFRGLTFRYREDKAPAIRYFDLKVSPGETVALVGRSGSGKTTLVSLLAGFYDVSPGQIMLDGIDIQDICLPDLRKNIAFVSQDVVLFNDTVVANIAYGQCAEASSADVRAAADAAHVTEFAQDLPSGFEELIGQNGLRLSGGQRQRLAIARALLKDAPMLVMDEATSALDTQSERLIQSAIDVLRKGRTTLVIAHRLSTVEKADRIVVMEKGEIVEIGQHDSLLAQAGLYAQLYRLQFGAAVGESVTG